MWGVGLGVPVLGNAMTVVMPINVLYFSTKCSVPGLSKPVFSKPV